MLIKKIFEEVALEEEAAFRQVDNKYPADIGSFVHSSNYILECEYRKVVINLKNEFGHQNIGIVSCQLVHQPTNCEFEIETVNNFSQLFSRKLNPLKFKVENSQFRKFIELNDWYDRLNKSANNDRFEPFITGKNESGGYLIFCKYHLVFNNKELVISPLIKLFKALIDFFEDRLIR